MAKHTDIDDYLGSVTEATRGIGSELRAVLDDALPKADGTIWHGHPVWMSGKAPLAGFKAYSTHVTFMIWHGKPISEPTGRLQSGTHMATVKIRSAAEIDRRAFRSWLLAAHAA